MHLAVRRFLSDCRVHITSEGFEPRNFSVVEIGSRDINGSARNAFGNVHWWLGMDIARGPGVEVVADAALWLPKQAPNAWEMSVCCEVFEHTPAWEDILLGMHWTTMSNHWAVVTFAVDPRAPHSGVDGDYVRDGEHYENLDPDYFLSVAEDIGWFAEIVMIDKVHGDMHNLLRKNPNAAPST